MCHCAKQSCAHECSLSIRVIYLRNDLRLSGGVRKNGMLHASSAVFLCALKTETYLIRWPWTAIFHYKKMDECWNLVPANYLSAIIPTNWWHFVPSELWEIEEANIFYSMETEREEAKCRYRECMDKEWKEERRTWELKRKWDRLLGCQAQWLFFQKKWFHFGDDVSTNRSRSPIFYTTDLIHFICRARDFIFTSAQLSVGRIFPLFLSMVRTRKSNSYVSSENVKSVVKHHCFLLFLLFFFFLHMFCYFCVLEQPNTAHINKMNGRSK